MVIKLVGDQMDRVESFLPLFNYHLSRPGHLPSSCSRHPAVQGPGSYPVPYPFSRQREAAVWSPWGLRMVVGEWRGVLAETLSGSECGTDARITPRSEHGQVVFNHGPLAHVPVGQPGDPRENVPEPGGDCHAFPESGRG